MSDVRALPPRWDGEPVEWDPFEAMTVFICPPARDARCGACGSDKVPSTSTGRVRTQVKAVIVRSWRLLAFRCTDCFHDIVYEWKTKTWWDLDDSDYTAFGSNAP